MEDSQKQSQEMLNHSSFPYEIIEVKSKLLSIVTFTRICKEQSRADQNMQRGSLTEQSEILKPTNVQLLSACKVHDQRIKKVLSALQHLKQFIEKLDNEEEISYDNLQTERDRNTKLQNAIADLRHHIAQKANKFDLDKHSVLQSCQRAIDTQFKCQFDKVKQELSSTLSKLDFRQFLQARTSDENALREIQLQKNCIAQFEEELRTITDKLRAEKKEWEVFMHAEMDKEQAEFKDSLRETIESEFKKESQRNIEIMVSQAKLACLEELKLAREAKIENILADARKQWKKEHKRDIPWLTRKRKLSETDLESELSTKKEKLCECEKQLGLIVKKMDTVKKLVVDG